MAVVAFLDVDGMEGESRTTGFEGQVELEAWDWGVANSGSAGGGSGISAGRTTVRALTVGHLVDSASTQLLQACVRGTRVRSAVLSVVAPGERPVTVLAVTLTDLLVTSVSVDGADGRPVETVTLASQGFEVRYVEQDDDGSAGKAHVVTWDGARRT